MGMEFYSPSNFPDDGTHGKYYPIENPVRMEEVAYSKRIQPVAQIQASVVAVFNEWFKSFFEPNYFNYVRIKTQSTFTEFKSFMKTIYKQEPPVLVIDPKTPESVEDSLFAQNMLNRYNMIDPNNDEIGAKLMYSLELIKTDKVQIVYRRNRFRFSFDTMMVEHTRDRQMNLFNMLLMNIRHNSKFMLERKVALMLPSDHVKNLARIHGYDYKSPSFLNFLNTVSVYPILRRILPNGDYYYFMQYDLHIQVEVPGNPSMDDPETSEAIEIRARVVDTFTFIADLPSEFLLLTTPQDAQVCTKGIDRTAEDIFYISPIYAELDFPETIGDYTLSRKLSLMINHGEVNSSLDLVAAIGSEESENSIDIANIVKDYVAHSLPFSDLVLAPVYANGSTVEVATTITDNGVLTVVNPQYDKLYSLNIYINYNRINYLRENKVKDFIGTIEKY